MARTGQWISEDDRVLAFLRWWGRELRGLFPRARPAWMREPRVLRIESGPEGETALLLRRSRRGETLRKRIPLSDAAGAPPDRAPRRGPVLRLAANQALARRLTPPRAAEPRLEAILRHEFAAQMPFPPDEAYSDHRVAARGPERLEVDLYCVSRPKLDRWRAALAAEGLAPQAATVESPDGGETGVDLLRGIKARARQAGAGRRRASAALVLLLLGTALLTPYLARLEQNAQLQAEVDALRSAARRAIGLEAEIAAAGARSARLAETLRAPVPRVAILEAATILLPDDAWLSRLEIAGDRATLDGAAAAAASLIGGVEASPFFADAAFLSPLTQAQGGGERFEIGASVIGAARPGAAAPEDAP